MDDTQTTSIDRGARPSFASPSERPRRLAPDVYRRRRRNGVHAAIAVLAVLIGIVGAATSGSGGHRTTPRVSNLSPVRRPIEAGSASSRLLAAENAAINHTLTYTPYVKIAGAQHRQLALTFDDGPGPYTPEVLAVLERYHVPATFFEVGAMERYFHASTSAIIAQGDPIGDHTETHAPMSRLKPRQQTAELLEQTAAIGNYGAPFPRMFRPPYGVWDSSTLALLRHYQMLMVLWSVDTDDWQQPGVTTIVKRALEGAEPGAIILLHDAGGNRSQTIAALPKIIRGLRRRGYTLVTVPKLLLDNPAPADQDVASLRGAGG